MSKPTNVRPVAARLYFLPIRSRMPLKFGTETTTEVTCARIAVEIEDQAGRRAQGWGETPLSVQWVWPSNLPYEERHQALLQLARRIAETWCTSEASWGHPIELGQHFLHETLPKVLARFNREVRNQEEEVPWLAALVCSSPFDLALHDAYGQLHQRPSYETYNADFMNADLAQFLEPAEGAEVSFANRFPEEFLVRPRPTRIPAWHLVGGMDPLDPQDLTGNEPDDGLPVLLRDWIRRDGLKCLKVKLRGNDSSWDYDRLLRVGSIALKENVDWLTADFNCTVRDPSYVNEILDRLLRERPRIYGMMLYVEQPFPYDLETHRIDVHSVSARKPLFMDESAHDWRLVRLGRSLGWTGVALKTCKTQTSALLSLCWARAHGMGIMVQDLSNPMLAQISHVLLAAHAGTIMGVESNGMQFYPEASRLEAAVHPGLYRRSAGCLDLSSIRGPGFGYRVPQIARPLPDPDLIISV
jgi:L-alanine-DL-glutamate epimerase-like enolase superfamily enzyme